MKEYLHYIYGTNNVLRLGIGLFAMCVELYIYEKTENNRNIYNVSRDFGSIIYTDINKATLFLIKNGAMFAPIKS